MSMKFTIELKGLPETLRAIEELGKQAVSAFRAEMRRELEDVIATSKEQYVPVDLGTLRDSAFIEDKSTGASDASEVHFEGGFGGPSAPYAEIVHENPRSGKTQGITPSKKRRRTYATTGQWKYLETPFKAATAGMDERIAAGIRARVPKITK